MPSITAQQKDNPHEYVDEDFANAANAVDDAVWAMWEAGATVGDILTAVKNALENAE